MTVDEAAALRRGDLVVLYIAHGSGHRIPAVVVSTSPSRASITVRYRPLLSPSLQINIHPVDVHHPTGVELLTMEWPE